MFKITLIAGPLHYQIYEFSAPSRIEQMSEGLMAGEGETIGLPLAEIMYSRSRLLAPTVTGAALQAYSNYCA